MEYFPMESINQAIKHVKKRLKATVRIGGGHIVHMLRCTFKLILLLLCEIWFSNIIFVMFHGAESF